MYKLSVPIALTTLSDETRAIYAAQCREAGASRIFHLIGGNYEITLY